MSFESYTLAKKTPKSWKKKYRGDNIFYINLHDMV